MTKYYKDDITFFVYAIEKDIIDAGEIVKWADREILGSNDITFFLIDLSLTTDLGKQFGILNDVIFRENISFENISFRRILDQISKIYRVNEDDTLNIISKIFHIKDDVCLAKKDLDEIYILDDKKDSYLSGNITFHELQKQMNKFLSKYVDDQD